MPPPATSAVLAAALAGVLWSIGAIDVNVPSLDRMGLFLAGLALAGLTLAGRRTGALVALLALAGFWVGFDRVALPTMLYATWGIAAFRTTDGGNDVAAAVPVVAALVALSFADRPGRGGRIAFFLSAALLGWALAFKQFAVLVVPLVVRHLAVSGSRWRRYLLCTLGVTALFDLPFLIWDGRAFVMQHVVLALTNHRETWGANLLHLLVHLDPANERLAGSLFVLEVVVTLGALAFLLRWRVPTLGAGALAAGGLIAVPLLLARWTTQSYYVYAATIALVGLALVDHVARAPVDRPPSVTVGR